MSRRHHHPNLLQPAGQIQLCSPFALTTDNGIIQTLGQVNPEEKPRNTRDVLKFSSKFLQGCFEDLQGIGKTDLPCAKGIPASSKACAAKSRCERSNPRLF